MITMPPRHGKSETATVKFPSWYLGRNPSHRVILASYSASLAWGFSRRVRNDFGTYAPDIFGIDVSTDMKAKNAWDLKGYKGGVVADGVEGSLTGKGAELLIIDDPHKDAAEAASPVMRAKVYEWYKNVARIRLHPGGRIVIIQTRWHEADLIGSILHDSSKGWYIINLPALAEDEDYLGRAPGQALWPERYDEDALKAIRKDIGSYAFASLFQQRPAPPEGALVKKSHLRYYTDMPERFDKLIQCWDLAVEAKDTSSFVVGQVWGKIGPHRYLLDQFRARADIIGSMSAIRNMRRKWPLARTTYIEKKANGAPVIQILQKELDSIAPFDPLGSKEQRLNACLPLFEGGNIFFPDPSVAIWVNDLVYELVTFPHGVNDDQVDCLSMAQDRMNTGYALVDMDIRPDNGIKSTLPFAGELYGEY